MKSIPRKIFVLIIANISRPFESFLAKIWVKINIDVRKITKISSENKFKLEEIMKNQNEKPTVTISDLNLGEDVSILNWINKSN